MALVESIQTNLYNFEHFYFDYSTNSAFGQHDYAVVMVHSYSGFLPSVITTNTFNYWEPFG